MTERSTRLPPSYPAEGAEPGVQPGSAPSAGTIFAALFGELTPSPLRDSDDALDAYALFYARSQGMGWLDNRGTSNPASAGLLRAPGLWEMNDAGWEHKDAPANSGQVSWFQVDASAVPCDRPLPAQPFLHCAESCTRRAGRFSLSHVRIHLPAAPALIDSPRAPYAPIPSLLTQSWSSGGDPADRVPVQISISADQHPRDLAALTQLGAFLASLQQSVFTLTDAAAPSAPGPDDRVGPFGDPTWRLSFWNAPDRHGAVLSGHLAEWTGDAIGWLAGALADCFIQLGGQSPLRVTIAKQTN